MFLSLTNVKISNKDFNWKKQKNMQKTKKLKEKNYKKNQNIYESRIKSRIFVV
jgi:hypothetical protein